MNRLSDDIIIAILQLLDVTSLIRFSASSSRIYNLQMQWDQALYHPALLRLSNNKCSRCLIERIKLLSMSTLKKYLKRVDVSTCLEKGDYQRELHASILLQFSPFKSIKTCPWVYRIPPWKSTYLHYCRDMKRQHIMLSELCNVKWMLKFKYVTSQTI
jgi:F-box domain